MKYTPGTIAKAIAAFATAAIGAATVAAGGPDLSVLTLGDVLGALGAGLIAGGATFGTPNKDSKSATDAVVAGIPVVLAEAKEAQDNLEKVRKATSDALGEVPVFGPAARDIINNLPRF
jgi:hypothetical protein